MLYIVDTGSLQKSLEAIFVKVNNPLDQGGTFS